MTTVIPSYVPGPAQTDQQARARAQAIGIGIAPREIPPVYANAATNLPGVVAEYGQGNVVFIHDDGALTSAQVAAAVAPLIAQQAADATTATNQQTIRTNVQAKLATIETFIANNPGGATLNAAQTLVLAKLLAGLCRVVLQLNDSTSAT